MEQIKWYEWLYLIDSDSNVYSEWRFRDTSPKLTWTTKRWVGWKKLKPVLQKDWYLTVTLYKNKKSKVYRVHRLMGYVYLWLDINDSYMFVCHKDDNPLNNNINNLFLWTNSDNMKDHRYKHPERHFRKSFIY
jgi:hypothetical protein